MRTLSRFPGALIPLIAITIFLTGDRHTKAEDPQVAVPNSDCTFDAQQMRSPRQIWQRLSQNAELVAPSAAAGSRRRTSLPGDSDFVARNFIDTHIFGKMKSARVQWTVRSSDEEFLRRVSLDLTGAIPDSETVKSFLADPDPAKRDKMIDRLLASDAFADRWSLWFGDLVMNVQVAANTIEYYQGRNAYHKFIRDSIAAGKPYDQFVRELTAGVGKSFTNGEANYWVRQMQNNGPIQDTYDNHSAFSAEKFLGIPLTCLSCHSGLGHLELVNSDLAKRTRMEFWKNAAFFAQTTVQNERDVSTNSREYTLSHNTNGLYRLNTVSGNKSPRQPASGQPAFVDPGFILTGEQPRSGETRRQAYGRILTAHPQFARATVNQLWKELFGFGIVEPLDGFDLLRQDPSTLPSGATLQPTHPELLNDLANSFAGSGFSLRAILKTIVQSNAYQLSSRYAPGGWEESWTPYHARHYPRRMMAEVLLDAIFKSTKVGASLTVTGSDPVPRAVMLPDPTEGRGVQVFLNAFGRGDRDDQLRSNDSSIVQALSLLNDRIITDRVRANANNSTVQKLTRLTPIDHSAIVEGLYLATLSRYPTASERQTGIDYLKSGDLQRKTEDLQFALINKLEFLFQ